jgi:hypothetical protein
MAYYGNQQQQQPTYGGYQQQPVGGYAPPGGFGQPPPQPYNGGYQQQPGTLGGDFDATPLLAHQDSHAIMRIEKSASLAKRETALHRNFDIDTLQDIDGLQDMKASWQFRWETILGCWVMFNAVSTIMIILTNFRRAVSPQVKAEFGEASFNGYMDFITYFPLAFFLVAVLLFNNYYSEITFYMYLKRGCIIDFPPSANMRELLKRPLALFFLFILVGYLLAVFVAFVKFHATIGVYLIFANNLFVGIGMSWYRQQSIESKFVSISNFIQSFPDRDDSYGNMDEQSLHQASKYLQNVTLTECESASYSGYMRTFYWENRNYSTLSRIMHHVILLSTIGVMAGLCVAYFVVLRGIDLESLWKNEINPCVNSCIDGISNATGLSPLPALTCATCTCRCMQNLQQRDSDIFGGCSEYWVGYGCGGVKACPSLQACEAMPFWGKN